MIQGIGGKLQLPKHHSQKEEACEVKRLHLLWKRECWVREIPEDGSTLTNR